ncbi:MAG: hypothetical protein K1X57_20355 [Gemmataceae bacterium]|nr:hypothetical protein [Gemmataceae bacterium]
MYRVMIALFVGLAGLALTSGVAAEDKKSDKKADEKVLKGSVCCAKCELGVADKCATVIKVKENGKDVVYYFDAEANKKHHSDYCKGSAECTVKGKISEKDGKKIVTVSSLEKAKK